MRAVRGAQTKHIAVELQDQRFAERHIGEARRSEMIVRRTSPLHDASVAAVAVCIACAAWATAAAGPREDALAVVERWVAAFTASDIDAIVALHAPDALFIGTGSRSVINDPAAVRTYFERALLNNRPRSAKLGEHMVTVVSDSTVIVTGLDTVTSTRDGIRTSAVGRVTFVIARRAATWEIVHFHRSALPD